MNNNKETLPLPALIPSKANPRKRIEDLEGLAASIKQDGLLQNLVVEPSGKKGQYRIISGHRRYYALKLLNERGELPDDYAVKVEIRKGLSTDDSLRIALVENLQRSNLSPLEETAALTKLIHKRVTLEEIAAQAGLSPSTIKRRLALNGLCKEAKKALKDGAINLAQGEALTLGVHEDQAALVGEMVSGRYPYSAEEIRETFLESRASVADGIFPLSNTQEPSPRISLPTRKPAISMTRSNSLNCSNAPLNCWPMTTARPPHGSRSPTATAFPTGSTKKPRKARRPGFSSISRHRARSR